MCRLDFCILFRRKLENFTMLQIFIPFFVNRILISAHLLNDLLRQDQFFHPVPNFQILPRVTRDHTPTDLDTHGSQNTFTSDPHYFLLLFSLKMHNVRWDHRSVFACGSPSRRRTQPTSSLARGSRDTGGCRLRYRRFYTRLDSPGHRFPYLRSKTPLSRTTPLRRESFSRR